MRLDAVEAKVGRAQQHFHDLDALVQGWLQSDAYRIEPQLDFNSGEVVVFAEALKEPPSVEWGPVIGDVVHNLRSALHHLIFALSEAFEGPAPTPIPRKSKWWQTGFPIVIDCSKWPDRRTNDLWAMPDTLAAAIQRLQPFETGKDAPEEELLAVLDELWNVDKHRHLHLVNVSVELAGVLPVEPFPGAPQVDAEVLSKRDAGPLKGRTEIARLMPRPRPPVKLVNLPHVHMNPRLTVDVAFSEGPPAYGGRVLHLLSDIGQTVHQIIAAFSR